MYTVCKIEQHTFGFCKGVQSDFENHNAQKLKHKKQVLQCTSFAQEFTLLFAYENFPFLCGKYINRCLSHSNQNYFGVLTEESGPNCSCTHLASSTFPLPRSVSTLPGSQGSITAR